MCSATLVRKLFLVSVYFTIGHYEIYAEIIFFIHHEQTKKVLRTRKRPGIYYYLRRGTAKKVSPLRRECRGLRVTLIVTIEEVKMRTQESKKVVYSDNVLSHVQSLYLCISSLVNSRLEKRREGRWCWCHSHHTTVSSCREKHQTDFMYARE